MSWKEVGDAWGERAADWAFLFEPLFGPVYEAAFARVPLGPGVRYLDVACGAGRAAWRASSRGASVSGLDAADALLAIARERVPEGDFRAGDMCALPFPAGAFDVVSSFNGIFFGDDGALAEVARVTRTGGAVVIGFWSRPKRRDHLAPMLLMEQFLPDQEWAASANLLEIGKPGVAEKMMAKVGIEPVDRLVVDGWNEWPDVETGVRAFTSSGPAWPIMHGDRAVGYVDALGRELQQFSTPGSGVRLRSEFGVLIGRRGQQ